MKTPTRYWKLHFGPIVLKASQVSLCFLSKSLDSSFVQEVDRGASELPQALCCLGRGRTGSSVCLGSLAKRLAAR